MPFIPTAQSHIDCWLKSAITSVVAYLVAVGGEAELETYHFLVPHLETIRQHCPQADSWDKLNLVWQKQVEAWDAELEGIHTLPLMRLRQAGLKADHLRILMLVGLVELDARFGHLYGMLYPLPDDLHLSLGLLDDLLRYNRKKTLGLTWPLVQDLEQRGLIALQHPERPRAARTACIPTPVWEALSGEPMMPTTLCLHHLPREKNSEPRDLRLNTIPITWLLLRQYNCMAGILFLRKSPNFESFNQLKGRLSQTLLDQLKHLPELVERGLTQGVILRGMRGSGQLQALKALARLMERDVLYLQHPDEADLPNQCRLLGPLAVLRRALPIIEMELAPGAQVTLPPLAGYKGLFGLILTHEGSVIGPQVEGCVTLEVPAAKCPARQQQWKKMLGVSSNGTQTLIDQVSQNYHLTLGAVTQAGPLARAYAALHDRSQVTVEDVQAACRALNQQSLENLANRIPTQFDNNLNTGDHSGNAKTELDLWKRLIVSPQTQDALETLVQRCRYREVLLDHLGPGFAGTSRGVKALFSGVSGTGKTLAARIVAAQLGLDLYRIDLSSVISKYIGETERNLSQLFARAEEQDIMLLLDEGDSLLTARTDVSNSNDRYANMETNYLLQRLEQYDGIILITTNAPRNIDTAFQRRIDVSIEFSLPDAEQRYRLWHLHLPDAQKREVSEFFLHDVALRCQLSGGQIRNAALHATVLAVEKQTKINDEFLSAGIHREYNKIGASAPLNKKIDTNSYLSKL